MRISDWSSDVCSSDLGNELRPRITLRDSKGEVLMLVSGAEARYYLSADAILSVEDGAQVHAGDVLARNPVEGTKTRDITGGLQIGRASCRERACQYV